jgi:hypothetical protein
VYSLAVNDSVSEAAQLGPGESLARIADSEYAPSSVSAAARLARNTLWPHAVPG